MLFNFKSCNKSSLWVWTGILLVIVGLGVIVYLVNQSGGKDRFSQDLTETKPVLVSLDNDWNLYSNPSLGFSMKLPKKIKPFAKSDITQDMMGLQDGNVLFLTFKEHFAAYKINERIKGDGYKNASDIAKVKGVTWAMVFREVKNEKELNNFVVDFFGKNCKTGKKLSTAFADTVNVLMDETNLNKGDNACVLDYNYAIKYSAKFGKATIWALGRDYSFPISNFKKADSVMFDSFQFVL